jgi:hypothetical protein
MTDQAHPDLDCISFAHAPGLEPFIEAAQKAAARIGWQSCTSGAAQWAAVNCVRALEVAELYPEMHASKEGLPLLFRLAQTLAAADVTAAWEGLQDVPAALLPDTFSGCRIALPLTADRDGRSLCALWLPLGDTGQDLSVAWYEGPIARLCGPVSIALVPFSCARSAGLLGMPLARVITLAPGADGALELIAGDHVSASTWQAYVESYLALLLGLLDGACRRLMQEAYAYARERRSAGKAISLHQAVALRLAEIAMNQQALSLYICAALEQANPLGTGLADLNAAHVADLAFRISRDAVQIAAGHGYVDGLPFKRLFEQVGTLSSVLATCCSAVANVSHASLH